jgi:hypothetical protein
MKTVVEVLSGDVVITIHPDSDAEVSLLAAVHAGFNVSDAVISNEGELSISFTTSSTGA